MTGNCISKTNGRGMKNARYKSYTCSRIRLAGVLSQRLRALRNTAREGRKLGSLAMAKLVAEFL